MAAPPEEDARKEQAMRQFQLRMGVTETLKHIQHVVCVMSGKGGVGKSTVAVNLAVAFARSGHRTGLADFDFTNPNDPGMLGVKGQLLAAADEAKVEPLQARDNLTLVSTGLLVEDETPIAWRGPIKMGVMRQFLADVAWGELDVLVVDLPPGTSDEAISVVQNFPEGTPCLLVTSAQATSLENVRQNVVFCEKYGLHVLGVVQNYAWLACPHCDEHIDVFPGRDAAGIAEALGTELLASLPLDPAVGRSQDQGVAAVEMVPPGPTGEALAQLADEVWKRLQQHA